MNLEQLLKMKKDCYNAMKEFGPNVIKKQFKDFFDKHDNVELLTWTQGTPSFNDGEPCIFSIDQLEFKLKPKSLDSKNEDDAEDEDYDDEDYDSSYCLDDDQKELKNDLEVLENIMQSFEGLLQDIYGDGVRVKITKKEITVDEHYYD